MTRVAWTGWASLVLPSGWIHDDGPEMVDIYNERNGVGALQLSFARRTREGVPTVDEAVELSQSFAEQRRWKLDSASVSIGSVDGCPCAEFSYTDSSTFWQVWHIVDWKRAAFITYVSDSEGADKERIDREAIVKSFRWE